VSDERVTSESGAAGSVITLATLRPGEAARVVDVGGEGAFRRRLLDMGFTSGAIVRVIKHAPFRDPIEYCIGGTHVTLREQEARQIVVDQVSAPPACGRHHAGRGRGGGRGLGHGRLWRRRSR
jgi:ferrous iron transport protein A